jgi:hypothetical protein
VETGNWKKDVICEEKTEPCSLDLCNLSLGLEFEVISFFFSF